jgi:hypothetical protein
VQILAAIGTGIGILGFVTFFGAVIFYIRLHAVHLPATEGVAAVPREVLLVTGATFLVPAALLALGAVALLYMVDSGALAWERHIGASFDRDLRRLQLEYGEARVEAEKLADEVEGLQATTTRDVETAGNPGEDVTRATQRLGETLEKTQAANAAWNEAKKKLDAAAMAEVATQTRREDFRQVMRNARPPVSTVVLTAIGLGIGWLSFDGIHRVQLLLLIGAALLTAALAFAIYASTESLLWFGVAAFVSIGVVFGMAKYFSTGNEPKVSPAAVLRANHEPAAGYLVADTSSKLLLGRTHPISAGDRLVVMPRDQVQDMVVGEQMAPPEARIKSLELAIALCQEYSDDKRAEPKTQGRTRTAQRLAYEREQLCSPRELANLRDLLGREQAAQGITPTT